VLPSPALLPTMRTQPDRMPHEGSAQGPLAPNLLPVGPWARGLTETMATVRRAPPGNSIQRP